MKIRWLGPARVLLREDDENGTPTMYWIALEEVEKAKIKVKELKSRGVTRYHDLNLLNKASIDDVNTDEGSSWRMMRKCRNLPGRDQD